MFYKLVDKKPVPCSDGEMEQLFLSQRHLGLTEIHGIKISTVFLCIDHNFSQEGGPILFETMIFNCPSSELNHYQKRYRTWEEAERGHEKAVDLVKSYCSVLESHEPNQ